jgi:hypothetical protein
MVRVPAISYASLSPFSIVYRGESALNQASCLPNNSFGTFYIHRWDGRKRMSRLTFRARRP